VNQVWQDVRYAVRMLAKSPVFTSIAVLTLALGIGGNTAIFSVVNSVLLKPLPYGDPDRLVILSEKSRQFPEMSVSYPNYEDWKAQTKSFEQLSVFRTDALNLTGTSAPEHLQAKQVSAGFLALLGVHPVLGREFLPEEDHSGAPPVVMIGYGLWKSKFGGDRQIVGKSIVLSDMSYTVVGVLPEHFWFYTPPDVMTPAGNTTALWRTSREMRSGTFVVARLRPVVAHRPADDRPRYRRGGFSSDAPAARRARSHRHIACRRSPGRTPYIYDRG